MSHILHGSSVTWEQRQQYAKRFADNVLAPSTNQIVCVFALWRRHHLFNYNWKPRNPHLHLGLIKSFETPLALPSEEEIQALSDWKDDFISEHACPLIDTFNNYFEVPKGVTFTTKQRLRRRGVYGLAHDQLTPRSYDDYQSTPPILNMLSLFWNYYPSKHPRAEHEPWIGNLLEYLEKTGGTLPYQWGKNPKLFSGKEIIPICGCKVFRGGQLGHKSLVRLRDWAKNDLLCGHEEITERDELSRRVLAYQVYTLDDLNPFYGRTPKLYRDNGCITISRYLIPSFSKWEQGCLNDSNIYFEESKEES